ncbi:MAG: glyoxylate reductase [Alphaproteobacteria bacterium]|jgi:glyoxylate reductase
MKPSVFVFQPIPQVAVDTLLPVADVKVYPHLDRMISMDEMIAAAKRHDYLLALHENFIPAEVLRANPDLKGVGILGGKTGMVDYDVALELKVPVVSAGREAAPHGGPNKNTADLTVALVLNLAYRVIEADRYTHAGKFKQNQTMALMGVGGPGKTVGLIGLGSMGAFMAPVFGALGMKIIYNKRSRLPADKEQALGVEWVGEMDDVFRQADFVVVACPLTPETIDLIGARHFALMKPTAFFINTARGRIVVEADLVEALKQGQIAGAGIETFATEPPERWEVEVPEALCKMENVILTPHNGGATWDTRGAMLNTVAQGIVALIEGQRPATLMNPEVFGDATLYPDLYGRGPAVPVTEGGPAIYAY